MARPRKAPDRLRKMVSLTLSPTFIGKARVIADRRDLPLARVVDEALQDFVRTYEARNGEIHLPTEEV